MASAAGATVATTIGHSSRPVSQPVNNPSQPARRRDLDLHVTFAAQDEKHYIARRSRDNYERWRESWDFDFDLTTISGNSLQVPFGNEHHVMAGTVDGSGRIHVAANMHNNPLRYVRCSVPDGSGTASDWAAATMIGTDEVKISYPVFLNLPDGDLLFTYRSGEPDPTSPLIVNRWNNASATWSRQASLLLGTGTANGYYTLGWQVTGSRVSVAWVWEINANLWSDPSYAYSDDKGLTWRTVTGAVLTLPITKQHLVAKR